MKGNELEKGKIYRLVAGDFAQFSRVADSGFAICYAVGGRDNDPSAFTIDPKHVTREATEEEADRCCKAVGISRPKPYESAPPKMVPAVLPGTKKPKSAPTTPPEPVTEEAKKPDVEEKKEPEPTTD